MDIQQKWGSGLGILPGHPYVTFIGMLDGLVGSPKS